MLTNNWFSRYTQNDYTSHDKGYYHRILEYSSRVQVSIIFVRTILNIINIVISVPLKWDELNN